MNVENGMVVRERFNTMANSHEALINHILKKNGIEFKPGWSFRKKIDVFKDNLIMTEVLKDNLIMTEVLKDLDLSRVIADLYQLDSDWTFVKHGNHALNFEGKVMFIKNGLIREFNDEYMDIVEKQFSENQVKLCNIANTS